MFYSDERSREKPQIPPFLVVIFNATNWQCFMELLAGLLYAYHSSTHCGGVCIEADQSVACNQSVEFTTVIM